MVREGSNKSRKTVKSGDKVQFHSKAKEATGVLSEFLSICRDLSNFAPFPVEWNGQVFPTVEHAFQAAKYGCTTSKSDPAIIQAIAGIAAMTTPQDAKRAGGKSGMKARGVVLDVELWETVKDGIMQSLLQSKVERHSIIRKELALIKEHNIHLVHFSRGDKWWGAVIKEDGTIVGQNRLGELLMRISEKY